MFCPKCGSILMPKTKNNKRVIECSCGYKEKDLSKFKKITEIVKPGKSIEVIEEEIEILPLTDETCSKCGNLKAYYWTVQTRAGDEPETKFLKCEKCKHIWRDYS
jgi:DNA-directed RNA polymerase subunit M